jgi:hypothetical protein
VITAPRVTKQDLKDSVLDIVEGLEIVAENQGAAVVRQKCDKNWEGVS